MKRTDKVQLIRDVLSGIKKISDFEDDPYCRKTMPAIYILRDEILPHNANGELLYKPHGTDLQFTKAELIEYHKMRGWLPPILIERNDDQES